MRATRGKHIPVSREIKSCYVIVSCVFTTVQHIKRSLELQNAYNDAAHYCSDLSDIYIYILYVLIYVYKDNQYDLDIDMLNAIGKWAQVYCHATTLTRQ